MLGLAASDDRRDSALADEPAVLVVVVAAVADHLVGPLAWPADESGDSGDAVEQRDQLRELTVVDSNMVGDLRMWLYRAHPGNPRQMRRRRPLSASSRTPRPAGLRLHPV